MCRGGAALYWDRPLGLFAARFFESKSSQQQVRGGEGLMLAYLCALLSLAVLSTLLGCSLIAFSLIMRRAPEVWVERLAHTTDGVNRQRCGPSPFTLNHSILALSFMLIPSYPGTRVPSR